MSTVKVESGRSALERPPPALRPPPRSREEEPRRGFDGEADGDLEGCRNAVLSLDPDLCSFLSVVTNGGQKISFKGKEQNSRPHFATRLKANNCCNSLT